MVEPSEVQHQVNGVGKGKVATPEDFRKMAGEIYDLVERDRVLLLPVYGGAEKYTPAMETALTDEGVRFVTFPIEHHPASEPNPRLGYRDMLTFTMFRRSDDEIADILRGKIYKGLPQEERDRMRISQEAIEKERKRDREAADKLRHIRHEFKPEVALLFDDDATMGWTSCGAEVWALERIFEKRLPVSNVVLAVVADNCRQGGVSNFSIFPGYQTYIGPRELVTRMADPRIFERLDSRGLLRRISDYEPHNIASVVGSKVPRYMKNGGSTILYYVVDADGSSPEVGRVHHILEDNGVRNIRTSPISVRGDGLVGIDAESVRNRNVIVLDGVYDKGRRDLVRDRLREVGHPSAVYVSMEPPSAKGIRAS